MTWTLSGSVAIRWRRTLESIDKVSQWLDDRPSLGWTDLDRMAEVVAKQLQDQDDGQKTHVIYVGDGIATARDANPQAAAGRLRRAFADVKGATFHSVSIGSSFESGVLQALASVGGGSVRQIDGEQTAQRTALELLNEMMQPGLTDLKVEFRGIEVAAVYPQRLPNLGPPALSKLSLDVTCRPAENQSGEIVITGKRNGEASAVCVANHDGQCGHQQQLYSSTVGSQAAGLFAGARQQFIYPR